MSDHSFAERSFAERSFCLYPGRGNHDLLLYHDRAGGEYRLVVECNRQEVARTVLRGLGHKMARAFWREVDTNPGWPADARENILWLVREFYPELATPLGMKDEKRRNGDVAREFLCEAGAVAGLCAFQPERGSNRPSSGGVGA